MNPLTLSGLDLLRKLVEGSFPAPTIAKTIPMALIEVTKGHCVFEAFADDNHLNPMGGVHGGFAATVLDSATGCAVHTMLEAGIGYGTIDLNVKMMRPIPMNVRLLGEGRVINLSKSLGVSEATLKDENGKLYAHATATCKLFPIDVSL